MITAVAIVCAVIVAGLLLHAWFDATGRELQSTVDRVLSPPLTLGRIDDPDNPCYIADYCKMTPRCGNYAINCRQHEPDDEPRCLICGGESGGLDECVDCFIDAGDAFKRAQDQ